MIFKYTLKLDSVRLRGERTQAADINELHSCSASRSLPARGSVYPSIHIQAEVIILPTLTIPSWDQSTLLINLFFFSAYFFIAGR